MINYHAALFVLAIVIGQVLVWFQTNGQLIWHTFANNTLLAALAGIPISYIFIYATRWGFAGFDGKIWPVRLVGFAVGMMVFTALTWIVLHETPEPKTFVCLALCIIVVLIQIFF